MSGRQRMTRRTVLRGLGTALTLPWLEAFSPARADGLSAVPRRLAIVYVPNGVHMPDWTPADTGPAYTMPRTLQPLKSFRDDLPILLAGRGGGTVKPGRHLRYKEGTPLMNLWLALLERLGAPAEPLGDGTGSLPSLQG
jgi:hypothetical protein